MQRTVLKHLLYFSVTILWATPFAAQQPSKDKTVSLNVTVTDQHDQFVGGVDKERLILTEKSTPLQIVSITPDERPVSVAILLDLSGSQNGKVAQSAKWIADFIAHASTTNEYLIVGFNKGPRVLCDWGCGEKELAATLAMVSSTGWHSSTAFYDACDFAVKSFAGSKHQRHAMVVISDGLDNLSKVTFYELKRGLKRSDVTVYGVARTEESGLGSSLGIEGEGTLAELAMVTGGRTFARRLLGDYLKDSAEYLASELKHQYLLSFKPAAVKDGKPHEIKMKVRSLVPQSGTERLRLKLRYKQEFYDQ